ncbi:hypothetical protein LY76DRAFT_594068, partial [Colletotrichum caudatum]
MRMDAHSPPPDRQDESAASSSSSPLDTQEREEPAPVAEPSRAPKRNRHKAGASAARGAPRKRPVQCDREGCGRWFPRPTEL